MTRYLFALVLALIAAVVALTLAGQPVPDNLSGLLTAAGGALFAALVPGTRTASSRPDVLDASSLPGVEGREGMPADTDPGQVSE